MSEPARIDVAEQGEVQQRTRSLKERQRESDAAIKAFMAHPQGRAWVWDMLAGCQIYTSSFSPDAASMAFREGERNVGLRLLAQLQRACPDLYVKMTEENSNG